MASHVSSSVIVGWLLKAGRHRRRGFTLIELLVATIIGSIIVSLLLFVVLELLQVNRREELLTQTQQDMKRAINYMTSDVGEAVFIYADPTTVTAELSDLPADTTPVLAFWRLDSLSQTELNTLGSLDCGSLGTKERECAALKLRQSVYTLVVYLQANNDDTDIWEGETRIIRYRLPKYEDIATLDIRDGYADPSLPGTGFADWTASGDTDGIAEVLTDHVDAPTDATDATLTASDCDPNNAGDFVVNPTDRDNFYACLRTGEVNQADGTVTRTNQSVILFVRGNAIETGSVALGPFSEASRLPTLRSEVLIRGVIEELPE